MFDVNNQILFDGINISCNTKKNRVNLVFISLELATTLILTDVTLT